MNDPDRHIQLSIVIPCLNEEETLGLCITKAFKAIRDLGISGEVVVADNGSIDQSASIAESLGARVVYQPLPGYGNALMKGVAEAQGKFVIMGDADDSYDFSSIAPFMEKLNEGYDLVMGTRLKGTIHKGAMPFSHRWGNPLMTWILNLFYRTGISDVNCGMRGFTKKGFERLNLRCGGMEFASEFVVKAIKEKLSVAEIPITYYKDKRTSPPHLRTFSDAWRHMRFLLLYCPSFLYLVPGVSLLVLGFFILIRGLFAPFQIANIILDYHYNFLAAVFAILGAQLCLLGIYARAFAYIKGFDKYDTFIKKYIKQFSLERGALIGLLTVGLGMVFFVTILVKWIAAGGGVLFEVRKGIIGIALLAIGFQHISFSFLLSMLLMESQEYNS
ncbi:MAG: glycosyltransferase family 2 protein [Candidatus Omnitrophica bacterium]|nr:glycosyltransferase family 2 protein [Candidatus Omnitrophota bacterium]